MFPLRLSIRTGLFGRAIALMGAVAAVGAASEAERRARADRLAERGLGLDA